VTNVWAPIQSTVVLGGIIFPTVIDVRINKGNAAQSFIFKTQGWRSMGGIMENTPFLILVVIMQPLLYVTALEYFGQIAAIAIPWSIMILGLVWLWASGKIPFSSDEEE
jgi:ABC-type methionine transport system permease subunit